MPYAAINSNRGFVIRAGGPNWHEDDSNCLINALSKLHLEAPISCVLSIPENQLSALYGVSASINDSVNLEYSPIDGDATVASFDNYDLAISSSDESEQFVSAILSAGLPLIELGERISSTLPKDSVVSIEYSEFSEELLAAYVSRLIIDDRLRERMGANARWVSKPKPHRDRSGRFPKIPGIDFKRGAREYDMRLDAANRSHLLTKPFYNL